MTNKAVNPKLAKWAEFFGSYWNSLNSEQRSFYVNKMKNEEDAPSALDIEEIPGMKHSQLKKHMGDLIKLYRNKKGIEQKRFAEILGKKSSHLSLIESGEKMFTVVDLARAIKILGIPPSELFNI